MLVSILYSTYQRWGNSIWSWSAVVLFFCFAFSPLLALIIQTIQAVAAGPGDLIILALPWGRRWVILLRSLILAGAVALGAMLLGLGIATVLWRFQRGWQSHWRWFMLVLAPIPAYIHALAWMAAVGALNSWLHRLGGDGIAVPGLFLTWWIQVMAFLPLAVGISLVGLETVDATLIEAGKIMASDLEVLAKVILPLAAPVLTAGAALLFILSLVDYSVPALFGVNVYALEIFAEYSASHQSARALIIALPILLITVSAVAATQNGLSYVAHPQPRRQQVWTVPPVWPPWFRVLQSVALVIFFLQIMIPLITLLTSLSSLQQLLASWQAAENEVSNTFRLSLFTALACLPIALLGARELLRTGLGGRLWWLIVTLPLAVPPSLIGIGLISLNQWPPWSWLYGTEALPLLATLARFIPLAVLIMLSQWRKLDPLLLDAAALLQTNSLQTWLYIKLPMLAPGLIAASCLVFALSSGELEAVLIVAPPGQATLTMRIYNYLHYGASNAVAGLCLVLTISAVAAGGVALGALAAWGYLTSWRNTGLRIGDNS